MNAEADSCTKANPRRWSEVEAVDNRRDHRATERPGLAGRRAGVALALLEFLWLAETSPVWSADSATGLVLVLHPVAHRHQLATALTFTERDGDLCQRLHLHLLTSA